MFSPNQYIARRFIESAAQHSNNATGDCRGPEPIEPIHHAAVPGNNVA
jgi:hypothetical protein